MKQIRFFTVLTMTFLSWQLSSAQLNLEISEWSVSLTDTQNGMPFIQLAPIHPGIEIGATVWENEKAKSHHKLSGRLGYFHHDVLAMAPYLKANYIYQVKFKETIGLDLSGSLGYIHVIYPGEGYKFDADSRTYKSATIHEGFLLSNVGLGFTYINPEKFQPFVKYDVSLLGFDLAKLISVLHIGLSVQL